MENSKIEWCDHTFNPWYGCTNVSPGCDNCYAECWSKRSGLVKWGNNPRKRTTESYWKKDHGRLEVLNARLSIFEPKRQRFILFRCVWRKEVVDRHLGWRDEH
jgi:protein gp37